MVSFQSTVPALLIVRKLPSVQAQNMQVPIYSQSCTKTCRCCSAHRQVWSLEQEKKSGTTSHLPPFFKKMFPEITTTRKNNEEARLRLSVRLQIPFALRSHPLVHTVLRPGSVRRSSGLSIMIGPVIPSEISGIRQKWNTKKGGGKKEKMPALI